MTREEIIRAISDDKMMPFIQPDQLAEIVDFVIKNCKPSLPSNMDEAANRQAALEQPYEWKEEQDGSFGVTPLFVMSNIRSAFKAGAEWMAGQGEVFDGFISIKGKRSLIVIEGSSQNSKYGDNIIVQIRKKQ